MSSQLNEFGSRNAGPSTHSSQLVCLGEAVGASGGEAAGSEPAFVGAFAVRVARARPRARRTEIHVKTTTMKSANSRHLS
jgi:hypothetical protein